MIKVGYDKKYNAIIIEFEGPIGAQQAEQSYLDIQKIVSKCRKGFKILTDFTLVDQMDREVQTSIKKAMDFLNTKGVVEILRVIPSPEKDFGFNILSIFHYSKKVTFLTLKSRKEAEELLNADK